MSPSRTPKVCARCGRPGRINARRPEGGICHRCYRHDPQVVKECTNCGRVRIPAARTADGQPLCERCWQPPERDCAGCGARAPTKAFTEAGPLCPQCYRRQRQPRAVCDRCGDLARIARRGTNEDDQVCYRCYRRSTVLTPCAVCGRTKECLQLGDGRQVCVNCRPLPRRPCAACGTERIVAANWPMGAVCSACYRRIRTARSSCPGCGQARPPIARTSAGEPRCGPCVGLPLPPPCRSCGSRDTPYARGTCARCVARQQLGDLLTGPDGTVPDQLLHVLHSLEAADAPARIISWLQSSTSARLLAELAAAGKHVTHDLLDTLPAGHDECYVRALLVHTAVLDPREEGLERIPPWLERILVERPAAHARLVEPYTHWVLLRQARLRASKGLTTPSTWGRIRGRVTLILSFLAWLDEQQLTLATVTQDNLDGWLTSGPRRRHDIGSFLTWAHQRGLTNEHHIRPSPEAPDTLILTEDQRWQELRRCLNDNNLPLRVRVGSTLTLLYGMPASTVRLLTTSDIRCDTDGVYLNPGRQPLFVPPRPAALVTELADHARQTPVSSSARGWLFPGTVPGQPLSTAGYSLLMRRHGFHAIPARNAALIALAGQLPVPVLAELLNIHVHTARKWASYSQPDWTTYLAERST